VDAARRPYFVKTGVVGRILGTPHAEIGGSSRQRKLLPPSRSQGRLLPSSIYNMSRVRLGANSKHRRMRDMTGIAMHRCLWNVWGPGGVHSLVI